MPPSGAAETAGKITRRGGIRDPNSGLTATIVGTGVNTARVTDTEEGDATDVHNSSGLNSAGSDSVSSNSDSEETDAASDHLQLVITTTGTDSQGNQYNLLETTTFDDSETDNLSNKDSQSANGADTDTFTEGTGANGQITDNLTGTVTSTDPTTGVKTVTSINVSITGSGNEQSQDTETSTTNSAGASTDVVNESDSGSTTVNWTGSVQVTQTNPDGSAASPPSTQTDSGSDTITWGTGLSTDSSGNVADNAGGTEAGSATASDPSVGTSSWSNQVTVLDAGTAPPPVAPGTGGSAAPPTVTPPAPTTGGSTSVTPVGGSIVASTPSGVMNPPKGGTSSTLKFTPKAAPRAAGTSAANLRATLGSAAGRAAGMFGNILLMAQMSQGGTPEQLVAMSFVYELKKMEGKGQISRQFAENVLMRGLQAVDQGFRPPLGTPAQMDKAIMEIFNQAVEAETQAQAEKLKAAGATAAAEAASAATAGAGGQKPPNQTAPPAAPEPNRRPVRSRIHESPKLSREAEAAGRSHQRSIDRLTEELARGNLNPGSGSKPIGGGISEARARDGARLYWRIAADGTVEILGKSNKGNQQKVIEEVLRVFGG